MISNVPPKVLTVQQWTANKGRIATMAGETGITKALQDLAAAYKRVPWDVIDPDAAWNKNYPTKQPSADLVRPLMANAQKNIGKVEPLRNQLKTVRDLARDLQKKWSNNRLIPKTSTAYAKQMADAAEVEFLALKNFGDEWQRLMKTATEKQARVRQIALQQIKPYFKSLRDYGAAVKQTPTVAQYKGEAKTGFHQNVRGLGAALDRSGDPQLTAWKEQNWKSVSQDAFLPKSDSEVLPKVNQVLTALTGLERIVG